MHANNVVGRKLAKRIGLTVLAENRLRETLRAQSPSEPWVDAQFTNVQVIDERGTYLIRRIHDPLVFPPGGIHTAMVRCSMCGIYTPPGAMEDGVCLDHAESENWGPSPSAQAIRALQFRNLRLPETELKPESVAALKRQIQRHERRQKTKAKRRNGPAKNLPPRQLAVQ